METQMSSYLEQAQVEHVMNEAKQQNKIEKKEARKQKWLKIKIKEKPKRKRCNNLKELYKYRSAMNDTEADERFALSYLIMHKLNIDMPSLSLKRGDEYTEGLSQKLVEL
uniref:Uncharacterized protein n=1 Tax=Wuchereria bancrofti TaxID=6293 RepID=A0A1I8EKR4_WUCBA